MERVYITFVFILDTSSVYHWCFKCHFKPNPIKSVLWSRLKGPLKQSTNDSIIRYSATKVLVKLPATPGRSGNLQRKSTFIANPSNYQHQSFLHLGIAHLYIYTLFCLVDRGKNNSKQFKDSIGVLREVFLGSIPGITQAAKQTYICFSFTMLLSRIYIYIDYMSKSEARPMCAS